MRTRQRPRGLYQVLTLLAIQALDDAAVPAEIRDLHIKSLKSPVHPLAVYPTLNGLLDKHYVVRHRVRFHYEKVGLTRKSWCYVVTEAGQAFLNDYHAQAGQPLP